MIFFLIILAIIAIFIIRGVVASNQRKKLSTEFDTLDNNNKFIDSKRNGYLLIEGGELSFKMRNKPLIAVPNKSGFFYASNNTVYPAGKEEYKLKVSESDFKTIRSLFESINLSLVDNVFHFKNKQGKGSLVHNYDGTLSLLNDDQKKKYLLTDISYTPVYVTKTSGKTSGRMGRTLVGGIVLGPVGALVGAAGSRKNNSTSTTTEKKSLGQIVLIDIETQERIVIDLLMDKNVHDILNKYFVSSPNIVEKYTNSIKEVASTNEDSAETIREFKKLLDDGIINQEEFDAKKKQLLGL